MHFCFVFERKMTFIFAFNIPLAEPNENYLLSDLGFFLHWKCENQRDQLNIFLFRCIWSRCRWNFLFQPNDSRVHSSSIIECDGNLATKCPLEPKRSPFICLLFDFSFYLQIEEHHKCWELSAVWSEIQCGMSERDTARDAERESETKNTLFDRLSVCVCVIL